MEIKGTAFLGREMYMKREIGAKQWADFMREAGAAVPFFRDKILATTRIPAAAFLELNDRLIDCFFGGDQSQYWQFGEASADWALTQGPYKGMRTANDIAAFAQRIPAIWGLYYSEGRMFLSAEGENVYSLVIRDLPIRHVYFEYVTIAFVKRGLELCGARAVKLERLKAFSRGDDLCHFRVMLTL